MDPDAFPLGTVTPIGIAPAAPVVGPKIVQLSPFPGNIYESDCFFYDSTASVSQGDFWVLLAFASMHSHPVTVHDCPDIYKFKATYSLAIVSPLSGVPPAILAWGHFPLSKWDYLLTPLAMS
jgi:hypothetical protein